MICCTVEGIQDNPFKSDEYVDELACYFFFHSCMRKQKSGKKTKHAIANA